MGHGGVRGGCRMRRGLTAAPPTPPALTSDSKVSRVQAKRWLLMPSVVKTHSSLGCSTAFSAGRAQWGGRGGQRSPHTPCSPSPPNHGPITTSGRGHSDEDERIIAGALLL